MTEIIKIRYTGVKIPLSTDSMEKLAKEGRESNTARARRLLVEQRIARANNASKPIGDPSGS
jgi:DNA helicase TIP49 (TBP-interacting protein)